MMFCDIDAGRVKGPRYGAPTGRQHVIPVGVSELIGIVGE
jgi:hypothetical protein